MRREKAKELSAPGSKIFGIPKTLSKSGKEEGTGDIGKQSET